MADNTKRAESYFKKRIIDIKSADQQEKDAMVFSAGSVCRNVGIRVSDYHKF